ncbi:hypothetical protein M758_5G007700 [Ceratodon purpureus]|nr:hypothetical protein M758_5G007700 [Ceratodon purpureus]
MWHVACGLWPVTWLVSAKLDMVSTRIQARADHVHCLSSDASSLPYRSISADDLLRRLYEQWATVSTEECVAASSASL